MKVEQIYTGCLAQGAYYIHSQGEGVIIDPLREVQPYIDRAERDGVKIKYILETHFHADFVSGHLTLSEKTGAPIVFGPTASPSFDAHIAKDGEILQIGNAQIVVLHTPGHTMESATYLLRDSSGSDVAIFTGDTLFLGDVGRPDLAQKASTMTQEELAGILYDSLRQKIMPLRDQVVVYPGHGAGSACGKNMMKETVDTLGNQRKVNYALREDMTKEEFIQEVTEGLLAPPGYFPLNVRLNKEGYTHIDEVLDQGLQALNPEEFELVANQKNALILDVRHQTDFAEAHIPQSIFVGLDGSFAPWVGEILVNVEMPILLVAPEDRVQEAITRLSRVGFDNTIGYLQGGLQAWLRANKEVDTVRSISSTEFEKEWKEKPDTQVFDVRKTSEYETQHLTRAESTPLAELNDHMAKIPQADGFYVHCAGGYRSMIAASILKRRGYHDLTDIQGGFNAIKETSLSKTDSVCPSTSA